MDYSRFTDRARQVVLLATEEARGAPVHTVALLAGLVREEHGIAARALLALGVRLDVVRSWGPECAAAEHTHNRQPLTIEAEHVLELALKEALWLHHNYIGTEHILLALIRADGFAATRMSTAEESVRVWVQHLAQADRSQRVAEIAKAADRINQHAYKWAGGHPTEPPEKARLEYSLDETIDGVKSAWRILNGTPCRREPEPDSTTDAMDILVSTIGHLRLWRAERAAWLKKVEDLEALRQSPFDASGAVHAVLSNGEPTYGEVARALTAKIDDTYRDDPGNAQFLARVLRFVQQQEATRNDPEWVEQLHANAKVLVDELGEDWWVRRAGLAHEALSALVRDDAPPPVTDRELPF